MDESDQLMYTCDDQHLCICETHLKFACSHLLLHAYCSHSYLRPVHCIKLEPRLSGFNPNPRAWCGTDAQNCGLNGGSEMTCYYELCLIYKEVNVEVQVLGPWESQCICQVMAVHVAEDLTLPTTATLIIHNSLP